MDNILIQNSGGSYYLHVGQFILIAIHLDKQIIWNL